MYFYSSNYLSINIKLLNILSELYWNVPFTIRIHYEEISNPTFRIFQIIVSVFRRPLGYRTRNVTLCTFCIHEFIYINMSIHLNASFQRSVQFSVIRRANACVYMFKRNTKNEIIKENPPTQCSAVLIWSLWKLYAMMMMWLARVWRYCANKLDEETSVCIVRSQRYDRIYGGILLNRVLTWNIVFSFVNFYRCNCTTAFIQ